MLAREKPVRHTHSGNNSFVGYVEGMDTVYMTCSTCVTQGVSEKPNDYVMYVPGTLKNNKYQWLVFAEEEWNALEGMDTGMTIFLL